MSKIICADAVEGLKTLPSSSVDMCVTSPPYYGLRDYGVDGQIGVEQSPQEYIDRLVKVFSEVYRVLKDDGTLWVNIADSYAGSGKGPMSIQVAGNGKNKNLYDMKSRIYDVPKQWEGIKPKDLIGIPWMLAFALRNYGWYLRSDIIWHKTNCLPESVRDRPVKCHEDIFLLAKSPRYYYDYMAIREPIKEVSRERYKRGRSANTKYSNTKVRQAGIDRACDDFSDFDQNYRRKRDVWEVSTNSFKMDEHFAMYPEKLIEPCILAGSREGGIVLDPFFGSGTTGAVAKRFGREYIGIDINETFCKKAQERIDKVSVGSKRKIAKAEKKAEKIFEDFKQDTCITDGYTTYTCDVCGETHTGDVVEATGHSYIETVVAPTCVSYGYTEHVCENCGDRYVTDYIAPTGHTFIDEVVAPTETEMGYTKHTCTSCGYIYLTDFSTSSDSGYIHDYIGEVVAPTCTEQGYTVYTCTICGDSYVSDYTLTQRDITIRNM